MKNRIILFCVLFLIFQAPLFAQDSEKTLELNEPEHKNYIEKGDVAINVSFLRGNKNIINDYKYETIGGEANAVYYLIDRIGFELNFTALKYKSLNLTSQNLTSPNQENEFLDNKKLILLIPRVRYNFYSKYHCATAFIQTGYGYGKFEGANFKDIHRWEIATIGTTGSCLRKFVPNLDAELKVSLNKDNLHDKLTILYKMGLTYQFGKLRSQVD